MQKKHFFARKLFNYNRLVGNLPVNYLNVLNAGNANVCLLTAVLST